jgi:hypothetical protein
MAQSNLAVISENGVFNVKSAVKNATLLKAKPPINDAVMYNAEGILLTTTQYQGNSLGEAIDAQAKAYKSIKKQAKAALEKLKGIGDILTYVRSLFKSDVLFGQFLMKTELSIMSRQDRSDAMWLADNWNEIQLQMKKLDISSSSASYLRQIIRKANATTQESLESKIPSKASPVVEKPVAATVEHSTLKPTVQESKASPVVEKPVATVQESKAPSVVESTVEPSTLEIIVDNAEAFADSIVMLAKSENLDLNAIIEALLKRI